MSCDIFETMTRLRILSVDTMNSEVAVTKTEEIEGPCVMFLML